MTRRVYLAPGALARRATVLLGSGYGSSPSTGARDYDDGFRNADLDAMRAAWSGGNPPVQYLDDGTEFHFRTAVRFTGPGRLTTTNPAHPWHVTPGDVIGATDPVAADLLDNPTGYLFIGVTLHHTDGTLEDNTLYSISAADLADPNYYGFIGVTVPDDVTGVTLWAEATGAGWAVQHIDASFASARTEASTVTIRRGRTSEDESPSAATLSATLAVPTAVPVSTDGSLQLEVTVPGLYSDPADEDAARLRFTGAVAVMDASYSHDGPNTLPVVAAGDLSLLSVKIGDEPWPAESAVARAARILTLALDELPEGQPLTGGLTVAARDVDRQPALSLLVELSTSSPGCRLIDRRNGAPVFMPPIPRDTTPALALTSDVIVEPIGVTQTWSAGQVELEYGPADARSTYTVPDTPTYNQPTRELTTVLADEASARIAATTAYATTTVPRWRIPDVTIDVLKLLKRARPADLDTVRALLLLEVGAIVELTDLPLSIPATVAGPKVLEGWAETYTADSWTFALYLSDAAGALEPLTWADIDPAVRWVDIDPGLTWLTLPAETTL